MPRRHDGACKASAGVLGQSAKPRRAKTVGLHLLLATHNEHKRREFARLLPATADGEPWELAVLSASVVLPPEEGETFAENALGKARAAAAATGRPSIADDSGIEAHGLGGRPGVRSARYAGENATDEENLAKLLEEVGRQDDRRVAYVSVIGLVDEGGNESIFEGRCEGTLATEPRGTGGCGYDPAFVPDDTGPGDRRTMAELSPEEKNAISHRGRAARSLATHLGLGASG